VTVYDGRALDALRIERGHLKDCRSVGFDFGGGFEIPPAPVHPRPSEASCSRGSFLRFLKKPLEIISGMTMVGPDSMLDAHEKFLGAADSLSPIMTP